MSEVEKKKEASGRISFFLEMFFTNLGALEMGFAITKDCEVIITDCKTGLSSTFTPDKFQEAYEKWAKENNI
ncbi:hypothetical protein CIW83_09430 [Tissierella sp. P1]|uniref:hypothetical protein n=1 Tax=Tissierella sp. P1 TaxID=1280483 RepID=UPI000BA147E4|nr:hypothetical protein [Tissierella sp. P1]OZV12310.1 hypothetical protein CIW83_09430 [Tissierella sp. P1]